MSDTVLSDSVILGKVQAKRTVTPDSQPAGSKERSEQGTLLGSRWGTPEAQEHVDLAAIMSTGSGEMLLCWRGP
jgi:hypothetical protein